MKRLKIFLIVGTVLLATVAQVGQAAPRKKVNLEQDMNSLGDDQAVVERAKALDPNNRVQAVQSRAVDRTLRFEIGVDYGLLAGGSSYLNSQAFGGNLDFHINPQWSIGARYYSYINNLSDEGNSVLAAAKRDQAAGNQSGQTPWVDSPVDTTMGVIQWYPVYGKLNFFNSWIPHFDIYTLLGFGRTNTEIRGGSNAIAAGGGVGIWLTNTFAMRFEGRYQSYEDSPTLPGASIEPRRVSNVIVQGSIGILL